MPSHRLLGVLSGLLWTLPAAALDVICAGPEPAAAIEPTLSVTAISGYYWRRDPSYGLLVDPGSTGSSYLRGHTLGHGLGALQDDKLEILFPLDQVGGDPRNAKYTLKVRARSGTDPEASAAGALEVGAKLAHDVESFIDELNRQRTEIIFSPLNRNAHFVGDVFFLPLGAVNISADGVYETAEFPGTLVAKSHGGRWLLWLRLTVRSPAAGGSGGLDLGDLSLFCHFVDYPALPAGPDAATVGETSRFTTRSATDNHLGAVEYRWISLRFFDSRWEPGVIEQDWSTRNVLAKTWSAPGLYDLLVQARSASDPEVSNTTPRGLNVLVGPTPPEAIRYPLANDTGDYGVAWSESEGATRYDAERSADAGAAWTRVYSGAETSFDERVGEGRYRYRVRACAPVDAGTENCSDWLEGAADGVVDFGGEPSRPPVASIVRVSPETAEVGERVCFEGRGDDPDGRVAAYEWTSSRQGVLSDQAAFCRDDLVCGVHAIRLRVVDDSGQWSPAAERLLVVGATLAEWPLDGCKARDAKGGADGEIEGDVKCAPDRFGREDGAILFDGGGRVRGSGLPPVQGSFSLRLWFRPDGSAAPGEGGIERILAIHPDPLEGENSPPLEVLWYRRDLALRIRRGELDGETLRVQGVMQAWHHLALSRAGAALSVYLDGVLAGVLADAAPLGSAFSMGGAAADGSGLHGALDHVVYERRPLEAAEALAALIAGGPSVRLESGRAAEEAWAYPGNKVETLKLRLASGSIGRQLRLLNLRVAAEAPRIASFTESVELFFQSARDGDAPRVLVGSLAPVDERPGAAVFEEANFGPFPLPSASDFCLVLVAKLAPGAPIGQVAQFNVATADDLSAGVEGDAGTVRPAFVAGERRLGSPAVEGSRIRVVPLPLARLRAAGAPASVAAGPKVLHSISVSTQSIEGLRIDSVVYRRLAETTLDGVTDPRLFADRDRNGAADAGELLAAGAVDGAEGAIRFDAINATANVIAAGERVDLILLADLDGAQSGEAAGTVLFPNLPDSAPAGKVFFLVAALAFLFASVQSRVRLHLRSSPRWRTGAALAAILLAAALFAPAGGCGGGGGGGGAGAGAPVVNEPREIQLGLLHPDDLKLSGAATGVAVAIEGLPEEGILGPRYELTQ